MKSNRLISSLLSCLLPPAFCFSIDGHPRAGIPTSSALSTLPCRGACLPVLSSLAWPGYLSFSQVAFLNSTDHYISGIYCPLPPQPPTRPCQPATHTHRSHLPRPKCVHAQPDQHGAPASSNPTSTTTSPTSSRTKQASPSGNTGRRPRIRDPSDSPRRARTSRCRPGPTVCPVPVAYVCAN